LARRFTLFRAIMSVGAMLRMLNYVVAWLLSPNRRLDAGSQSQGLLENHASRRFTVCPMSCGARTTLSVYCRPVFRREIDAFAIPLLRLLLPPHLQNEVRRIVIFEPCILGDLLMARRAFLRRRFREARID
jgi:hypothetical protein